VAWLTRTPSGQRLPSGRHYNTETGEVVSKRKWAQLTGKKWAQDGGNKLGQAGIEPDYRYSDLPTRLYPKPKEYTRKEWNHRKSIIARQFQERERRSGRNSKLSDIYKDANFKLIFNQLTVLKFARNSHRYTREERAELRLVLIELGYGDEQFQRYLNGPRWVGKQ
jgi:hypothetical protein